MTKDSINEKEFAKMMLYGRLAMAIFIDMLIVQLSSGNEEVEMWALSALRELSKVKKGYVGSENEKLENDMIRRLIENA